ncbi:MAG: hypothetical protein U0694_22775 [Anaerolineae bacterium]
MKRNLEYAQMFKQRLYDKIQALLDEFAEGRLNRDQFHALYERYNSRLQIVDHAILSGNPDAVEIAEMGPTTLQVREETEAKALGLVIYHNTQGTIIETLGSFNVETRHVLPPLLQFVRTPQETRITHVAEQQWLVFVAGRYTTIVTLFKHEPSRMQTHEMERLHRDFEDANHYAFERGALDANTLGYPFVAFVQKKLGKA